MATQSLLSSAVPHDVHNALRAYAMREDRSVSQVVRWAIEDWLVRHTPWRPPGRQEATILKKRPLA